MDSPEIDPPEDEWYPLAKISRLLRRSPATIKARALNGEFEMRVTGSGRFFISKVSAMKHIAEMEERTNNTWLRSQNS